MNSGLYARIYDVVRRVPAGNVITYGQVAKLAGGCGPRQVGYAMAAVSEQSGVPWHRVVNSKGMVSQRADGQPCDVQRQLLEAEGHAFDARGRLNLAQANVPWATACALDDID